MSTPVWWGGRPVKIAAREGQHSESTTWALRYVAPSARSRCACGIVASSSREKSSISTSTMLGRWSGVATGVVDDDRPAAVAR